ncbi:hypothetical protein MTP99_013739 [Tenebrio molitor]|nr:hypothetical protein MTP99_013739 [Tenebrio molitor]
MISTQWECDSGGCSQDDTFTKAVLVVITWLRGGDCAKEMPTNFYSMIQSTNSHVRRLLNEKESVRRRAERKPKRSRRVRIRGYLLQCKYDLFYLVKFSKF